MSQNLESGTALPVVNAAAPEEFLCARCARHQLTCCQGSDIVVTSGDIERIERYTGTHGFTEYRPPANSQYAEQDDDPIWRDNVFRSDGLRRVLQQQPGGDCTFLGERGCRLPLETRPLICRLYPYDYTAEGLREELARGCPVELLQPGEQLLVVLDIRREQAEEWHRQLYEEIVRDGRTSVPIAPVAEPVTPAATTVA